DPAARLALLDADGIDRAILYPSLGLQWEGEVTDPAYALAHCRAYNRWIEDFCIGSAGRLVPVAHLSLGDAAAAAAELRRRGRGARRVPPAVHARRAAARTSRPRRALRRRLRARCATRHPHGHRSASTEPAPSLRRAHLARGRAVSRGLVSPGHVRSGRAAGV